MISIKIHFNGETRRTKVQEDITYKGLLESIISLFPRLEESHAPQLRLFYRDTDGDIITLSSDEEVATATGQLPPDGVWRLTARLERKPSDTSSSTGSGTHPLLDLFETLLNPLHSELEKVFKEEVKTTEQETKKEEEGKAEQKETEQGEATTGEATTGETTTEEGEGEKEAGAESGEGVKEGETTEQDDKKEDEVKSKPTARSRPVITYEIRMGPSHHCHCRRVPLTPFGLSSLLSFDLPSLVF